MTVPNALAGRLIPLDLTTFARELTKIRGRATHILPYELCELPVDSGDDGAWVRSVGQDFVLYRSDLDPAQAKVVICREVIAMMTTAGSTHDLAPIIGQLLAPVLMAHGGLDVVRRILGDVPLERNKVLDDEAARPAADVIPIGRARRSAN